MTTPAALLLAPDLVALYPRGPADPLGWALPGTVAGWTGAGNLQLGSGVSDPRAETGGGYGPHDPNWASTGTLYLPADAAPVEGMGAEIRGLRWVLSQVRQVADPIGGALACWAATATYDDTVAGDDA